MASGEWSGLIDSLAPLLAEYGQPQSFCGSSGLLAAVRSPPQRTAADSTGRGLRTSLGEARPAADLSYAELSALFGAQMAARSISGRRRQSAGPQRRLAERFRAP
jgi:hypothetical protein